MKELSPRCSETKMEMGLETHNLPLSYAKEKFLQGSAKTTLTVMTITPR